MSTALTYKPISKTDSQAQLNLLIGSENNAFNDNTWKFLHPKFGSTTLDFQDLSNIPEKHPKWPHVNSIDWILLTKQVWLSIASKTGFSSYSAHLNGLKFFWEALARLNFTQVTKDNCNSLLTFLLTHSWIDGRCRALPSIKSHANFAETTRLTQLERAFSSLNVNIISRNLTEASIKKNLKSLIPELTYDDLTYRDWTTGRSYDYLTLDVGRFYIEHCMNFFGDNYPLALALQSTARAIPDIATTANISKDNTKKLLTKVLDGHTCEEIKCLFPNFSITTIGKLHNSAKQHFITALKQARYESDILKDETLKKLCITLHQSPDTENIDRLRIVIWNWIRCKNKNQTRNLIKGFHKPISWDEFQEQFSEFERISKNMPCTLPSTTDYESIGLTAGISTASTDCFHRQLTRLVAQSGLTVFVALNGWRRSEFGFPRSSIVCEKNKDKLDEYAFPWRYRVNWLVPKTHDQIRINREITASIFILTEQLQKLHGVDDDQPVLYSSRDTRLNVHDSTDTVKRYVPALWENFVKHYQKFKLLDEHAAYFALKEKVDRCKTLDQNEETQYNQLLNTRSHGEWLQLTFDVNLKHAWTRTRNEYLRIFIATTRRTTRDTRPTDRDKWLVKYRNNALPQNIQATLDNHLTLTVKEWLDTLSEEELSTKSTSRIVSANLLEGTLYPTPHAFRHMWAEAVYRRFDGDVGWMIRSQFQHISKYQWLAYIRDKDNRNTNTLAKIQVVSSLVRNYLAHNGNGYAGQLDTWLRRIIRKTTVATPEEQEFFVENMAYVEIEDIKANPWGYCFLIHRTRNTAKCAEAGEPMRYNASPELCLGCPHNLMQKGNIEWSLFYAAAHVEALNNPILPNILKTPSFQLVKDVAKQVRSLDPSHKAIPELDAAMSNYKKSRAI